MKVSMKMRKWLLTSAFLLVPTGAFAADPPAPLPAPVPQPVPSVSQTFNWTGFYAGLNGGWAFGEAEAVEDSVLPAYNGLGNTWSFDTDGFTGGVQAGYNYQVNNWLFGVEADFGYFGLEGSGADPASPGFDTVATVDGNWLGTARLRTGVVLDRWLIYATGGLAVADVDVAVNDITGPTTIAARGSDTTVGWTLGAGAEVAIADGWSLKGEYLYLDLGDINATGTPAPAGGTQTWNVDLEETHVVRVGLNYQFGY